MQHSNILYLTKNCNLKCDYCFESGHHKNESISYSGVDSFIDDVVSREPDGVSTVCFFGGEPFLEIKKMIYAVDRCVEISERTGKKFAFSVITNGTLLHKYIDELRRLTGLKDINFSLVISYDGSYQYVREKSGLVERNMELLLKEKIPFGISYTYMVKDIKSADLISDLVRIIKRYFSGINKNRDKIRVNFDFKQIEDKLGMNYFEYVKLIQEKLDLLYIYFGVPICHLTCRVCGRCRKDLFDENSIICVPENNSIRIKSEITDGPFDHF